MCNLYSMTKNVDAIRRLFNALNSEVGNLPSMPGIFPDYPAPVVRNGESGQREITMMRWGMPTSQRAMMDATNKRARKLEEKGKMFGTAGRNPAPGARMALFEGLRIVTRNWN